MDSKYDKSWNFEGYSMKDGVHGIHPYPAMLMPKIAQRIFNDISDKKNKVFFDPFCGSGTTLVEGQIAGFKKACGSDLNPLALLITRVKTEKLDIRAVQKNVDDFFLYISKEGTEKLIPNFSILNNYFKKKTIDELGHIAYFINQIKDAKIKDFFNVAFSETIRLCSFTRNGEFKLYRMTPEQRKKFNPDTYGTMKSILKRNLDMKLSQKQSDCEIRLIEKDSRFIKEDDLSGKVDVVVTSPPYGDSTTTVAYGQFSRLSNEWLGFKDPQKIDRELLGGVANNDKDYKFGIYELDEALDEIKKKDKEFTTDRWKSVLSFYKDYEESIRQMSNLLNKGATVVYVVGNRRVRNVLLQTDIITWKMFEKYGIKHDKTVVRDILNKRMPSKATNASNKVGVVETMTKEYIVFMTKE